MYNAMYSIVIYVFTLSISVVLFCSTCRNVSFSLFFFFKQKTAYEMRISDWSSDVCSSDLAGPRLDRVDDVGRDDVRRGEGLLGQRPDSALFPSSIGRASCRERVCQYV